MENDTQTQTAPLAPLVIGSHTLEPGNPCVLEIKTIARAMKNNTDFESNINGMLEWAAAAITGRVYKGKRKVCMDDLLYEEVDFEVLTAHFTDAMQKGFKMKKKGQPQGDEGKPE